MCRQDFPLSRAIVRWPSPPVKSRAGNRIVPMLQIVVATLRQIRDIDSNNPHRLVFHHTDGRPYAPREDSNLWKQLLKNGWAAS